MPKPKESDEEFARWCESFKQCKYCRQTFYGPVCPCEQRSRK